MTEASSRVKHGQLSQDVADDADGDAEDGDAEVTLHRRNEINFQKEFDPTRDRCQPEENKFKSKQSID